MSWVKPRDGGYHANDATAPRKRSCFWGHDWSRWQDIALVTGGRSFDGQKRVCERCGIREQRTVVTP